MFREIVNGIAAIGETFAFFAYCGYCRVAGNYTGKSCAWFRCHTLFPPKPICTQDHRFCKDSPPLGGGFKVQMFKVQCPVTAQLLTVCLDIGYR
jgi:hypothetical protein